MITCNRCKLSLSEDKFYKSSISKQHFLCAKCSVKAGKENRAKRTTDNDMRQKYVYAKNSAKSNRKPFTLTELEYVQIASKPCYYCESPSSGLGIGLDRINNDKSIGYQIGNVLPCCKFCNKIRNSILTVEETKVAIDAVMKLRKSYI